MLKIEGLSFSYNSYPIFSHLNFSLDFKDKVVITGPSGSGKTTLFRLICGALYAKKECIQVQGSIAHMGQQDFLLPWKTLSQNLKFAKNISPVLTQGSLDTLSVEEVLEMVHLEGQSELYPHQLSGGMRQRASLAQILLFDKRCLLLDEPLSSVDLKTKDSVLANLLQFLEKKETTLLMISHDVNDVVKLSAKHYALCGGKLIFQHNKK